MRVTAEGTLARLHAKASAKSTPAAIRDALVRLLEQTAHARMDDVEIVAAELERFGAGERTVADVVAAIDGALFWARWDRRFP